MFGKVNKESINQNNEGVDQEINDYKPETKEEKSESAGQNIAGNILAITGTVATLIGGIGAAILALEYIIGAFGLSALLTVAILVGSGVILNFCGMKLITNPWLPALQEV